MVLNLPTKHAIQQKYVGWFFLQQSTNNVNPQYILINILLWMINIYILFNFTYVLR
jgi:hypothetical protein